MISFKFSFRDFSSQSSAVATILLMDIILMMLTVDVSGSRGAVRCDGAAARCAGAV